MVNKFKAELIFYSVGFASLVPKAGLEPARGVSPTGF